MYYFIIKSNQYAFLKSREFNIYSEWNVIKHNLTKIEINLKIPSYESVMLFHENVNVDSKEAILYVLFRWTFTCLRT